MPQHHRAIDADVLFDAREESSIFLRLLLPGLDAPVGDAAVEVLPQLLAEFGLIALEIEHLGVGFEALHHVRISRVDTPRARARARNNSTQLLKSSPRACACGGAPQAPSSVPRTRPMDSRSDSRRETARLERFRRSIVCGS